MNVIFFYMYRDGSNNKNGGSVVFAEGELTLKEALSRLEGAFDEQRYFIAGQVGVPEVFLWSANAADYDPNDPTTYPSEGLGPGKYAICPDVDHCWHEFAGLEQIKHPVSDTRTLDQFVKAVEAAAKAGWKEFEPADLIKPKEPKA